MEQVKKIFVAIQFDAEEIEVGELLNDGKQIYFKYYPSFVSRGLEISPIKLKLNSEINRTNALPFELPMLGPYRAGLWAKICISPL
jgi:serine/threonine-protein kinase HipA